MTSADILSGMSPITERELGLEQHVLDAVSQTDEPFVIRGLASQWKAVQKAKASNRDLTRYLRDCAADVPVHACMGAPANEGRVFYNDDLSSMNFEQVETRLLAVLDELEACENDPYPPTIYMGSTETGYCLPDFAADNRLELPGLKPTVRIWLGNRHRVAAHYDVLENIAVVAGGRRRFILFPPEQIANLYVGPIEFTPAGQPISMVDFDRPDFKRFPGFSDAVKHARTAVLEPGDAVYIPSMWWHHVEGLERLNILVNHWWLPVPVYLGAPLDALMHAILSIRELPAAQRDAWRVFFDHYIFNPDQQLVEHLPAGRRGVLDPLDANSARKIRMMLRNKLNK
jgi:hypothetical protein